MPSFGIVRVYKIYCDRGILMTDISMVLLMLVVAMGLQSGITFFQIKAYEKILSELKGKGLLGIGSQRGGFFRKGDIVVISFDRALGVVNDCRRMQGIGSFQKFHIFSEWIGLDLEQLQEIANEENERVMTRRDKKKEELHGIYKGRHAALYQAVDAIVHRLETDAQAEQAKKDSVAEVVLSKGVDE